VTTSKKFCPLRFDPLPADIIHIFCMVPPGSNISILHIIQQYCIISNDDRIPISRAWIKILELLGQVQEGVSITELAARLGVDKASASRLVATLARYGYAEKDEETRRFHLGPQV